MSTGGSTYPPTELNSEPSIIERASALLKEVNLIYGLVSGIMLKFAFDWSGRKEKYDKTRSWLAVGLAVGSLVFSLVLLTVMGGVAVESLNSEGKFEPTLVVYWMVFLVVVVLVLTSLFALTRAVLHLLSVLRG
jgi:dipeptide/tripeptide permease